MTPLNLNGRIIPDNAQKAYIFNSFFVGHSDQNEKNVRDPGVAPESATILDTLPFFGGHWIPLIFHQIKYSNF